MMLNRSDHSGSWHLAYTAGVLVALLVGWEIFAKRFAPEASFQWGLGGAGGPTARRGGVVSDPSGNDNIGAFLRSLPERRLPRILVLGNSQVAGVKDPGDESNASSPHHLHRFLGKDPGPLEVVDLSAGGQAVTEAMHVTLGAFDRVRPNLVLFGIGLFSMQTTHIREAAQLAFPEREMRHRIDEHLPEWADASIGEALLEYRTVAAEGGQEQAKPLRDRINEHLAEGLAARLAMVHHRREMFNRLIDRPIRRDLVTWLKREVRAVKVARTYEIAEPYEPSLAALAVMARSCRSRGVPLVVFVLPFEGTRTPPPYLPATQQQLLDDLARLARQESYVLLDLGNLLGPECFGLYPDGSPDGLHFKASGHARLGQALAKSVAPLLKQRKVGG